MTNDCCRLIPVHTLLFLPSLLQREGSLEEDSGVTLGLVQWHQAIDQCTAVLWSKLIRHPGTHTTPTCL